MTTVNNLESKKTLRLILGHQLNVKHSWFEKKQESVTYVFMEVRQETDYATHHIQKIVAFFSAMRTFCKELQESGHKCIYISLDDASNTQSIHENILQLVKTHKFVNFEYQQPDEYRLSQLMISLCSDLSIDFEVFDSEHFLIPHKLINKYFKKNSSMIMETFYRKLRKEFSVLMDGFKPLGGHWNYDKENRKKLPKNIVPTAPKLYKKDVSVIVEMLKSAEVKSIGNIDPKKFIWPINRTESLELFKYFLENCLQNFGTYQDALSQEYWSVYHSRISFSLNTKMLSPLEIIRETELYWSMNKDRISLAQVEGFIRQILGWREFMRGLYWVNMPDYAKLNYFDHKESLPQYFWNADTNMNCIKQSVEQSLNYAYAHHIQRLMVTGNFMLLTGIHPDAADAWYLGIYIDALEWVEMPNTRNHTLPQRTTLIKWETTANHVSMTLKRE